MPTRTRPTRTRKAAVVLAAMIVVAACSGTPHVRTITLTFVRHAESAANAEDILSTEVPGPGLTDDGKKQAEQIAHQLGRNGYDGIYASTMVRTQQTAAPLSQQLGRQVEVLPGLRELDAGWYDDTPTSMADSTYMLAPRDWLHGDRANAVPGSVDGNEFNNRFSAAVRTIYDNGDAKPVAFSHGAAIMVWTLMNVKNPKDSLMSTHRLPNIGRVVITGSPATGWQLVDWDGIRDFN